MLICGFALKTSSAESGTYDAMFIASAMMFCNVVVFVCGFLTIGYGFPDVKVIIDRFAGSFMKLLKQKLKKKEKVMVAKNNGI